MQMPTRRRYEIDLGIDPDNVDSYYESWRSRISSRLAFEQWVHNSAVDRDCEMFEFATDIPTMYKTVVCNKKNLELMRNYIKYDNKCKVFIDKPRELKCLTIYGEGEVGVIDNLDIHPGDSGSAIVGDPNSVRYDDPPGYLFILPYIMWPQTVEACSFPGYDGWRDPTLAFHPFWPMLIQGGVKHYGAGARRLRRPIAHSKNSGTGG